MAQIKFEEKMNRLKEIVDTLEKDDVELDNSLKLYEEGLKLSKELKTELEKFEEKVNDMDGEDNE